MLPQTWAQIAVVLAAVVPGFVYQVSRRRVAGPNPDEVDLGTRILRAVMGSAMFAGAYTVTVGPWVVAYLQTQSPDDALGSVRTLGIAFLALVIVVPWLAARLWFYASTSQWWLWFSAWVHDTLGLRRQWDPTPSAWDFAFNKRRAGWVRVLTSQGTWVGGRFDTASFASSYPEPQELYLEVGYRMNEDGTFTSQVSAPGGVYVRCADAVVVDFNPDLPENGDEGQEA